MDVVIAKVEVGQKNEEEKDGKAKRNEGIGRG